MFNVSPSTKGRRGKFAKNIYLVTDSKKFRIVKYTIKANIKPVPAAICSSPSTLKVEHMRPNEKKNISFLIKNTGALDLILNKGIMLSSIQLKTKFPLSISPGKAKKIELFLTAPFYEGKFRGNLMFKTNDKARPKLWVLVTCDIMK